MNRTKRWLRCEVSPGMFSDERTVQIDGRSFFVDQQVVRNVDEKGLGEVEVMIVEEADQRWVVMPTNTRESFPIGA